MCRRWSRHRYLDRDPFQLNTFPVCWIAGCLLHRSIHEARTDCAGPHHTRRPSDMMRCSHCLGVRSVLYPFLRYSVTPPWGRGPRGNHHAAQCWVAEGLRAGRPTTRCNRRTPLASALNPGRIARAASDAPAGDSCRPGYALRATHRSGHCSQWYRSYLYRKPQ